MKRYYVVISILLILSTFLTACQPQPVPTSDPGVSPIVESTKANNIPPTAIPEQPTAATKADLVLKNGYIYTVDANRTVAQAIAIQGDTIVYVGDDAGVAPYIGEHTGVTDLGGKMVLPGFIDSHSHALSAASEVYSVSLYGMKSVDDYRNAIKTFLAEHPGLTALQGGGWINPLFPPEGPSREILDELVPDIPAVLSSEDYHSVWVNSKALELAGITKDTVNPEAGIIERDSKGNPSGTLRESAANLVSGVIPPFTDGQVTEGLNYFQQMAHSYGMTAVHIPGLELENVKLLDDLEKNDQLSMYFWGAIFVQPDDDTSIIDNLVKIRDQEKGGVFEIKSVKLFMDGVIEGSTAYLEKPYLHKPGDQGAPLWDADRYKQMCAALEKAGFQIHVHSVGDASTRVTLDGFAYAREQNGIKDTRHSITHLQLVNSTDIDRFAKLGVIAVPQPYWFVIDSYYTQAIEYLGQDRADMQYPMKSFFDKKIIVASASDYPVTIPPRPLDAIEIGVRRSLPGETEASQVLVPSERVNVEDMIASFTINGAYAFFMEKETGSLEVGKKADLVVLDQNITKIDPKEIHNTKELLTIFHGKEVFRDDSYKQTE